MLLSKNRIGDENIQMDIIDEYFPLQPRWTLKENQKFEKKREVRMAKKIISLLQAFFHVGNTNKSNCYSAHDMLKKLNDMANKGELEFKIILRLETIQNWIASRYSSTCKCEMADIVLQREEQRH
ncbi:uncharacterized protein OCT59_017565 [Rhizophagus irregularis]|uniref:Uncharacterized protein n=1 Tax=Rhizophagus irregularis TaxID=588596 RepID=A0A915Z857_9GLOM|nr:hypothetical protein OCT59_017565 [Rhizophagus irregularis]CAB4462207.1 unnamed protein product [Rhizophagus irregularis]CAB5366182.1 unnamed protein product [Rhizophagus irregularis]CAG8766711.1 13076_t:CDS:2 [Rhizophagus irregularis]